MKDEVVAHVLRDLRIGVERRPEEAAVRAAQVFVEISEEMEREDRFARRLRNLLRLLEVGVPVEPGGVAVALTAHAIESIAEPRLGRGIRGRAGDHEIDAPLSPVSQSADRSAGDPSIVGKRADGQWSGATDFAAGGAARGGRDDDDGDDDE
ncbi:MAG: hypothetical protein ACXW2Q_00025 [Thermoanaerobaculia bacterium]